MGCNSSKEASEPSSTEFHSVPAGLNTTPEPTSIPTLPPSIQESDILDDSNSSVVAHASSAFSGSYTGSVSNSEIESTFDASESHSVGRIETESATGSATSNVATDPENTDKKKKETEVEKILSAFVKATDGTALTENENENDDISGSRKLKKGFIAARYEKSTQWKSYYFVLEDGILSYFESSTDEPPYGKGKIGEFKLKGMVISNKRSIIELKEQEEGDFILQMDIRLVGERSAWLSAIEKAI